MASNIDYIEQIKLIKEDVQQMANQITRDLAREAKKDLENASWDIISNYYDTYTPKYYIRTYNLYNMFYHKHPVKDLKSNIHKASLTATSFSMFEDYGIKPVNLKSNAYKASLTAASFSMFDNYGSRNHRITPDNVFDLVWNTGHRGLPYQSLQSWYPEIIYDEINYRSNTPHNLMTLFVNRWGNDFGKKKSKSIGNKYKKNDVIIF